MKKILINIILVLVYQTSFTQQFTDLYGDYLGQIPPGDNPVVFAPGIISVDSLIEHSVPAFCPDGNEVFWFVNKGPKSDNEKWTSWGMTMKRVGDRWTVPATSPFFGEIAYSSDGKRLYSRGLFPDRKADGPYMMEKYGNSWSEPKNLGIISRFPELKAIFNHSLSSNGTLYFSGDTVGLGINKDCRLYRSKFSNGEYTKPELLPNCINLLSSYNFTPFIAPDESYLIFGSNRHSPNDGGDLYICFHDTIADTWSEPVNMGEPVNSHMQERYPGLSPDGKYLFFTRCVRWNPPYYNHDIFWVSAKIIDRLKEKQK